MGCTLLGSVLSAMHMNSPTPAHIAINTLLLCSMQTCTKFINISEFKCAMKIEMLTRCVEKYRLVKSCKIKAHEKQSKQKNKFLISLLFGYFVTRNTLVITNRTDKH